MNAVIQQIIWSGKIYIYNVRIVFNLNRCYSFELRTYSSKNPDKYISRFPQKYLTAQLFSALLIIRNDVIIMINDAENSALEFGIHRNKLHLK